MERVIVSRRYERKSNGKKGGLKGRERGRKGVIEKKKREERGKRVGARKRVCARTTRTVNMY